ncbi:MAG: GNAT family N-acetyltransferase [Gemmataceae bacterium]
MIGPAGPADWTAALRLLYRDSPLSERRQANLLVLMSAGEVDPAGLLIAKDKGDIVGVQLAVPLAGSVGLLVPPVVSEPNPSLEDALVAAGFAFLRSRQAKIVQAVLDDLDGAAPLLRGGMRVLTRLIHLRHELGEAPAPPVCASASYAAAPSLFRDTLLRTYEGTLDCPELNGTRSGEEIIAGHQAQGRFQPELWRLFRKDDAPLGVLLLNPLRDEPAWDLSYLGVVPEQRRRGVGTLLLMHALRLAHDGGALELQVAVDERNRPALELYKGHGFAESHRHVALLATL